MRLAIFETFSTSDEDSRDLSLHPIKVKTNVDNCAKIVKEFFVNNHYNMIKIKIKNNIKYDKDYNEIFGILDEYETTIHFIKDLDGKISIGVSIYGPTRRGRTRNRVRLILKNMRGLFKNYL